MSTYYKLIIISIVIFVSGLGLGLFLKNRLPIATVPAERSLVSGHLPTNLLPTPTPSLQTYRNDHYGFEFQYPSGYSVKSIGDTTYVSDQITSPDFMVKDIDLGTYVVSGTIIKVEVNPKNNCDSELERAKIDPAVEKTWNKTINNKNFLIRHESWDTFDKLVTDISKGNVCILMSIETGETVSLNTRNEEFEQLLSTLKFF